MISIRYGEIPASPSRFGKVLGSNRCRTAAINHALSHLSTTDLAFRASGQSEAAIHMEESDVAPMRRLGCGGRSLQPSFMFAGLPPPEARWPRGPQQDIPPVALPAHA